MKFRNLLGIVLLTLASVNPLLAQESTPSDIINDYTKELKLNAEQEKQFKEVLMKFATQFEEYESNAREYNALMKKETLEIYDILNREQFAVYKKLKQTIEPNKKYRIGND